jgi:hypothetical protein
MRKPIAGGLAIVVFAITGYNLTAMTHFAHAGGTPVKTTVVSDRDLGLIDATEISLGTLDSRISNLALRFLWRNKSNRAIIIDKLVSGCKCQAVEVSTNKIDVGALVEFRVKINLLGLYGNGGTSFAVKVRDDKARPLHFTVLFFRPQLPHAEPDSVDFGTIASSVGVTREFMIYWVADDRKSDIKLLDGVTTTDGRVSCRIRDQKQTEYRLANTAQASFGYIATFEATAVGGRKDADLHGTISIPLICKNDKIVITVPYRGHYAQDLVAHPSGVVLFAVKGDRAKETSIELRRETDSPFPETVTCECPDSRVTTALIMRKRKTVMGEIGKVIVKVDLSDGKSRDTEIAVFSGSRSVGLHIPVKVRVVPKE